MQLIALFTLALPAIAAAQFTTSTVTSAYTTSTITSTSATASSTSLDYEAICESQAYSYTDKCPQCLAQCDSETTQTAAEDCYYSTFSKINYLESVCQAQDGHHCESTSVNDVCS